MLRFDLVYNIPIDYTALSMPARTTYYYVALYSGDSMLLQTHVGWMCDSKSWEAACWWWHLQDKEDVPIL